MTRNLSRKFATMPEDERTRFDLDDNAHERAVGKEARKRKAPKPQSDG